MFSVSVVSTDVHLMRTQKLTISVYIPDSRMSPLIVRRRNLDRYGRAAAADSINEVVAVLLLVALSELVDNFHCLFLSPLMVAMGNI